MSRRRLLNAAVFSGVAVPLSALSKPAPKIRLAFDDPLWNREMFARLEGDTAPGKFIYGMGSGTVHGVRDGEAVRPLLGFELFATHRLLRQADGSYQRLCRELVFYRDLQTKQLLDVWDNPYTRERVDVVDVANDPFNYRITEFFPEPPSYGGLNADKPAKRPLRLNWNLVNDTVTLDSDIHLYYRSALDPGRWPRESGGAMNRVSELQRYFIRREDAENPALTHLPHNGVWTRVTPWLPWMLMGPAPGHVLYMGRFWSSHDAAQAAPEVSARVRERYPLYLTAPDAWTEPSYSSLENYARHRTPAPPSNQAP